jgi:uncharacterized protein YjlB
MTSLADTAMQVLECGSDSAVAVETHLLPDDGIVPNNILPLLVYRRAISFGKTSPRPERAFQELFKSHGWNDAWINGIYDYHHYHSTAHEVLGIAKGRAKIQLGGPRGVVVEVGPGDAVVIPAGVGHCLLKGEDLVVVGAYPKGQTWDLCVDTPEDRKKALENIPWVPMPVTDPVLGEEGPLPGCWVVS